jgi:hypothetical protein
MTIAAPLGRTNSPAASFCSPISLPRLPPARRRNRVILRVGDLPVASPLVAEARAKHSTLRIVRAALDDERESPLRAPQQALWEVLEPERP